MTQVEDERKQAEQYKDQVSHYITLTLLHFEATWYLEWIIWIQFFLSVIKKYSLSK